MNINKKHIAEFLGAIGVIVSLLFLAVEINQSNSIAMASTENEIRAAHRNLLLLVMEDSDLAAIALKTQKNESLTPEEMIKYRSYFGYHFSVWASIAQQYENGLLSEYSIDVFIQDMKTTIENNPLFAQAAAVSRDRYNLKKGDNVMWDALIEELELRDL